jgi:hypothetical protein
VQAHVNNTSTRDRNGAEALSPQLNCSTLDIRATLHDLR